MLDAAIDPDEKRTSSASLNLTFQAIDISRREWEVAQEQRPVGLGFEIEKAWIAPPTLLAPGIPAGQSHFLVVRFFRGLFFGAGFAFPFPGFFFLPPGIRQLTAAMERERRSRWDSSRTSSSVADSMAEDVSNPARRSKFTS
jgi:hypothetical protein